MVRATGITLSEMYVLERHRPDVARMFPEHVERDQRSWPTDGDTDA